MNLRGLDLNLLVSLDALLTEKNVTRAGSRIHLSQSAMSGALARLRAFFHDELLVQVGGKMFLTPLAQSLIKPVRQILLQIESTVATTIEFRPETAERKFVFMVSDYVASVLMSPVVRRLERVAPHISFEFHQFSLSHHDALNRGDIDFLIIPDNFTSGDNQKELLFTDSHTCLVWTGNSEVAAEISFEKYLELGHVIVAFSDNRNPSFESWFSQNNGYIRRVEVVAHGFTLVPQFLIGTNRIATVPTSLARLFVESFPLKIVNLPVEVPKLTLMVQWHQYQNLDPACVWLRGILSEAAAELNSSIA